MNVIIDKQQVGLVFLACMMGLAGGLQAQTGGTTNAAPTIQLRQAIVQVKPANAAQTPATNSTPPATPSSSTTPTPSTPPSTNAPATNPPPSSSSATNATAAPQGLAASIPTMNFDRTPEALFQAVQSQKSGGKLSEAEKFRLAVLLGDWAYVGRTLEAMPRDDGNKAYSRLLDALATNSLSAEQLFQQISSRSASSSPPSSSSSGNAPKADKRTVLLSGDFYALVDAAPGELEAGHIQSLSALVKVAVGSGGKEDFLKRLGAGMKGFGGTTPAGRKLAAQLLSSVGWITEAGTYLPLQREEWSDADTLTLVLTLEHFTQMGVEKRDERQLKRAAEVCAFMMQTSRFGAGEGSIFRQATERFIKLLPALEAEDAEQLIRENFLTQPVLMVDLVLALGDAGQQAIKGTDARLRQQTLATQNILLRVLQGKKSALPDAVNVLVMNWLVEAEQTYRYGGPLNPNSGFESDGFVVYRTSAGNRPAIRTLEPAVILQHAPSEGIVRRLNPGLAQRVKLTLLKVNLLDPREPATLETLKAYLGEHPGQGKELCEDYLNAWVRKRTVVAEDPYISRLRMMGYSVPKPQAAGIPLTRLRQNKNVEDLRDLLADLRPLSSEPIEARAVVQSFMSIHSGAEVYRIADIEGIFGPPEKMNRAELMNLVGGMRSKLREQWRDPKEQQDASTNRTEEETKNEVSRGYRTALELVKRGLQATNSDWKEFIVRGQLFFDTSEYEFARQIKLTDYVNLRDEAFSSYSQAATLYAAQVPTLARGQWSVEPYQMWFFVMLGASDLSQLTRAAARSDPGLRSIGDAMRGLPAEAAEVHLERFGQMLGDLLPQVPANMKQRFLDAGLQVVGRDLPAAKTARDALASYQELLDEIQLRIEVDGSTRVGYSQPFGVFLSLDHSRQLARESGGFSKYLQNLSNQPRNYYMPTPAGKPINYRDEFSKNIHTSLDETFEVSSITFHDANVKPIDLPREGWQQTPLAYAVLRAKDASIDRIPSIQLDMDFSDQAGQVVLPVRTQVQPIEARDAMPGFRPCEELSLTFTMDEREWRRDGKVVVEVAARGHGLIPSHQQLFEYERPGFDVEVTDNGLSITQFESDGKRRIPQADRNWQFTYHRKKDLRGDVVLQFPALKGELKPKTADYKHYEDADLVAVDSKKAAAGVLLRTSTNTALRAAGIVAGVLAVAVLGFFMARRRPAKVKVEEGSLVLPPQITAFSVLAYLRRLQRQSNGRLTESDRQSLQEEIRKLEAAYFPVEADAGNGRDLEAIARKWQAVVLN